MERYHSIQIGDVFQNAENGKRIMVADLPGKVTVECRALDVREPGATFPAQVWRSVRDGSEHLRIPGKPEMYCRAGRAEEPPAGCASRHFAIAV